MWSVAEGFRVASLIHSDEIAGHYSAYPGGNFLSFRFNITQMQRQRQSLIHSFLFLIRKNKKKKHLKVMLLQHP